MRRFWDITRYWSKSQIVTYPHLYLATPLGVTPLEFRRDLWHVKNNIPGLSYSVVCVILSLAVFVQYWRVTDGWTDRQTTTAYTALASRRAVKTRVLPTVTSCGTLNLLFPTKRHVNLAYSVNVVRPLRVHLRLQHIVRDAVVHCRKKRIMTTKCTSEQETYAIGGRWNPFQSKKPTSYYETHSWV